MSAAMNWERERNDRDRRLTHEEADKLLQAAERKQCLQRYSWLRVFIRLGLYSGLRPWGMRWLEWRRNDLRGAAITLAAARETTAQKNDLKSSKAGREPIS